jgi:SAM-dependent methyltransferase
MSSTMQPADSGRATYEAFAPLYDTYTAGYQAERWTGRLEAKALAFAPSGRRLLDVGCGTGKSFIAMLERGWSVVGCDVSPAMLEVAREKVGDSARLEVADARDLPVLGAFDLVWALNDTLNYLLDAEELRAALAGMKANLGDGGVVLFDLNTLSTFEDSFINRYDREEGGRQMSWTGLEDEVEPGSVCEARFEVVGEPAATHVHRQRHFPESETLAVIDRAGLECLEVWGDYEGEQDKPLDEARHQKAIYIAR